MRIQHFGQIMIHDTVKIGKNVTIYNSVTIGLQHDDDIQGPVLGDDVYIGSGAKILGTITIGNNVSIGANAVVLTDVPDNCLAVGVPARMSMANSLEVRVPLLDHLFVETAWNVTSR